MPRGALGAMRPAIWTATLAAAWLCPAATLLRSPYLQHVGRDRATILWATREPGEGRVEYSSDGVHWRTVVAETRTFTSAAGVVRHQHQADLLGLSSGQTYRYRVWLDGELLKDDLRLRTAGSGPFTFLVFGDSGVGSEEQAALAKRMSSEEDVALVLHTGDVSQDDGSLDRMEAHYFSVYAALMSRAPFFPTLGNHDYGTDMAAPYLAVHVLPVDGVPPADAERYYSFDWGDVHFVSLDSNLLIHPGMTHRMLEWLESDLQRSRRFWKLVFFHHPPYPSSHHLEDSLCAQVRTQVLPVLERYGVQLTFSGHEHNYQRSKPLRGGVAVDPGSGLVSIITGGGGAGLHPVGSIPELAFGESAHHYLRVRVEGWRVELTAVAVDGRIIERAVVAPAPQISPNGVVNSGAFAPRLAPGSLISVFGFNLAVEDRSAASLPAPTEMAATSVTLNGQALPLLFVSPTQINAQLPYGVEGPATLKVLTRNGAAETTVRLARAAPALLRVPVGGSMLPAIVRHPDGALVSSLSPAAPGETLAIYSVGLGEVAGEIRAGQPAPANPPLRSRDPVEVRLGERSLVPTFAGLVPGLSGVYQVNLTLPADLLGGVYPLRVVSAGAASEPAELAVASEPLEEQ